MTSISDSAREEGCVIGEATSAIVMTSTSDCAREDGFSGEEILMIRLGEATVASREGDETAVICVIGDATSAIGVGDDTARIGGGGETAGIGAEDGIAPVGAGEVTTEELPTLYPVDSSPSLALDSS